MKNSGKACNEQNIPIILKYTDKKIINLDLLFDFHMGNKISTSIVNIMAHIMTADNAEVGMYAKCGVRNAQAQRIMRAVTQPANGDLTPDAA